MCSYSRPEFNMAFQPIVDVSKDNAPFAYEALVRGKKGESAGSVFDSIRPCDAISFDSECRKRAIEVASFLGMGPRLSINISALAVGSYRYGMHATLSVARSCGWPVSRLIFEITEHSPVRRPEKLARWIAAARNRGILVALDDIGSGHANLKALVQLRPHIAKLSLHLIRDIDSDRTRRARIQEIVEVSRSLGCSVVAEGVESKAEVDALIDLGISLMQGYYFARPAIQLLPLSEIERSVHIAHSFEGR